MAERKYRMALLSKYESLAKKSGKWDQTPIYRYKEQWAADDLIESFGYDECVDLIEYYVRVSDHPTWSKFAYGADKIKKSRDDSAKDLAERAERLRKLKEHDES